MVTVKPKGPVPVAAIEWRIREDVPTNLRVSSSSSSDSSGGGDSGDDDCGGAIEFDTATERTRG